MTKAPGQAKKHWQRSKGSVPFWAKRARRRAPFFPVVGYSRAFTGRTGRHSPPCPFYSSPLTWDIIAGDAEFVTAGREEAAMPTSLVFGVTREQYDTIEQVQNLCADYEFSMEIGQIAYEMSKEIERSIGQVFSYFESI